jgi:hypothetical protein
MKRAATSSNLMSGCSYISHISLAASMGLPPPMAMMTSGLKPRSSIMALCVASAAAEAAEAAEVHTDRQHKAVSMQCGDGQQQPSPCSLLGLSNRTMH